MNPILVTYQEYCAIGFAFAIAGLFGTMKIWFNGPIEKDKE